jgi:hypothetical protein
MEHYSEMFKAAAYELLRVSRGERHMKIKILVSMLLITFLLMNVCAVLVMADVPAEPHGADAMWVEPSSITFTNVNGSIGQKFNMTLWLNMTKDVFNYQVALRYNRTQLKCLRVIPTARPTSVYMSSAPSGTTFSKVIDTSFLGNGSILASETCSAPDYIPGPNSGSLFWAEFQIMVLPTSGNFTSKFDISTEYLPGGAGNTWAHMRDPDTGEEHYWDINTFDAVYTFIGHPGPSALSVSVSPTSASIFEGQSVFFTSTVNGGIPPYTYQWYINGTSVPGANSNNWTFTPLTNGSYNVYLNVTDNAGTTATSNTATVTVMPPLGITRISVDPQTIRDLTMGPSSTFYINITIANVTDLKICQFNLTYDPTVLRWIGISLFKIQDEFPVANLIVGDTGFIWVSLNYSNPIIAGDPIPIVTMRFHVEAYGATPLHLGDTQLLDSNGHPIDHQGFDGFFTNQVRDVAVTNVVPSVNWIYQGWSLNVNVTVKNLGNVSETFTASAYYDSNLIGTLPVINLAPNVETTVTIPWNTFAVPEGNYTIEGVASTVPYEYNTTNNIYVDGIVHVATIVHDVAITNVSLARTWVYQGLPVNMNVTAKNLGNVSESFNVSAYMDTDLVGTAPVTDLASNAEITLTFTWNTTLATPCHNYTAQGEASLVPYEYNTTNNVYVDGILTVRLLGDIDGDGKVDGKDLGLVGAAFASYGPDFWYPGSPPSPRWDPNADVNGDNKVDGKDLGIVASRFGASCPP